MKTDFLTFDEAEAVLDITQGPDRGGWCMALCPAHNDNRPSLAIKEAEDGSLIPHCFAECTTVEVINAIKELLK